MHNPDHAFDPRDVAKDLTKRLAIARSWARSGQRILIPNVTVNANPAHVALAEFRDDAACKAERYGVAFGVTFVQNARVCRIEIRIRIKTHISQASPPYVAVYVARRAPPAEMLVNFSAFKSAGDYARFIDLETSAWFGHWLQTTLDETKTQKLLGERGVATADLSELALEQACVAFTNALPGCATFEDDSYRQHQRAPKEALAAHFRTEQLLALRANTGTDAPPDADGVAALASLGRSLFPAKDPSAAAVAWLQPRDHHFTQRFDDAQWAELARAVAALLDTSTLLDARLQAFNQRLADCGTHVEHKSTPVQRRSLASYFLALLEPANHLHLDAMLLNRFLLRLDTARVAPADLTGAAYRDILNVALAVEAFLWLRGFEPRDLLDVHGFMRVVTGHVGPADEQQASGALVPPGTQRKAHALERVSPVTTQPSPNVLIEGVPGVGKFERAVALAVEICDNACPVSLAVARQRFDALVAESRICIVAFHPAFTYAQFIEGPRANDAPAPHASAVQDGLLKCFAKRALGGRVSDAAPVPPRAVDRQIFKVSLGNALDAGIEDYCLEHGVIAIGGADNVDLSTLPRETDWEAGRERIMAAISKQEPAQQNRPGVAFALWNFKDKLETGDLVLVPRGTRRISAIGLVEGPYRHEPDANLAARHVRPVRWLAKDLDIPAEHLYSRALDQQAIYALDSAQVDFTALEALLRRTSAADAANFVLIIDGIDRVDAADVFGEAGLLIDASHRLGAEAPLELTLPQSGEPFGLPHNLHLIATRNARGPALAESLRQRFRCERLAPEPDAIAGAADGCIEGGRLDLRRWLRTLNTRLAWLAGHQNELGHGALARVTSLDSLQSAYHGLILPHVTAALANDPAQLIAVLGPRLVHVGDTDELAPLHPAARRRSTPDALPHWRLNATPTIDDFASLYEPPDSSA